MIPHDALALAWRDERARRMARFRRSLTIAGLGVELGPCTVVARKQCDRWGAAHLAVESNEPRILALLSVAHWSPAPAQAIHQLARASAALARGDRPLAAMLLAHLGLPRLAEDERIGFRLFAAERLLDAGVDPRELLEGLGIAGPGFVARKAYDPNEPRIPAGQPGGGEWTDGGSGAEGNDPQVAQEIFPPDAFPPDIIFSRPPVAPIRPPFEKFPTDPAQPPGPGYIWRGTGPQGSKQGNWHNPETGESLHPDMDHPPPVPPHWDYRAPDGNWYNWWPDGTVTPRSLLIV